MLTMHHSYTGTPYWAMISSLGGGAVTCGSKKQPIIVLSMTEAEYITAAHAMKEAMWPCTFMGEIATLPTVTTTIHCNNQSAIALSKDGQYYAWTKHINIWFHFICKAS